MASFFSTALTPAPTAPGPPAKEVTTTVTTTTTTKKPPPHSRRYTVYSFPYAKTDSSTDVDLERSPPSPTSQYIPPSTRHHTVHITRKQLLNMHRQALSAAPGRLTDQTHLTDHRLTDHTHLTDHTQHTADLHASGGGSPGRWREWSPVDDGVTISKQEYMELLKADQLLRLRNRHDGAGNEMQNVRVVSSRPSQPQTPWVRDCMVVQGCPPCSPCPIRTDCWFMGVIEATHSELRISEESNSAGPVPHTTFCFSDVCLFTPLETGDGLAVTLRSGDTAYIRFRSRDTVMQLLASLPADAPSLTSPAPPDAPGEPVSANIYIDTEGPALSNTLYARPSRNTAEVVQVSEVPPLPVWKGGMFDRHDNYVPSTAGVSPPNVLTVEPRPHDLVIPSATPSRGAHEAHITRQLVRSRSPRRRGDADPRFVSPQNEPPRQYHHRRSRSRRRSTSRQSRRHHSQPYQPSLAF